MPAYRDADLVDIEKRAPEIAKAIGELFEQLAAIQALVRQIESQPLPMGVSSVSKQFLVGSP